MLQRSLQPNMITFSALISACSKGRRWQQSPGFLDNMRHIDFQLDVIALDALISACERGQQG